MPNAEHPINGLMDVTLEKIRKMVDSNTIIGNPITTAGGATILPVSKVTFGFTSGGSEFVSSKVPKELFGGGSGAGVSISPIAFLVIQEDNVRLLQLADDGAGNGTIDRALNMIPQLVDTMSAFVKKGKEKPSAKTGDKASESEPVSQPEEE